MKTQQLYRYTRTTAPGEENVLLEMVEDNGDRVLMRPVNLRLTIPPLETIARSDVESVDYIHIRIPSERDTVATACGVKRGFRDAPKTTGASIHDGLSGVGRRMVISISTCPVCKAACEPGGAMAQDRDILNSALAIGDSVRFADGVKGTVTGKIVNGIVIDWEDGQTDCAIAFDDGGNISMLRSMKDHA
jgi:hypothetical protein